MDSAGAPGALHLQLSSQGAAILRDGARIALAPRDAVLLTWLAFEGPTRRARLATLLWPDADDAHARANLRQRVFQLRRRLGFVLLDDGSLVALAAGVTHDLDGTLAILDGVEVDAGAELLEWLSARRRARLEDAVRALSDAATRAEEARDWPQALAHAQQLLALAPLAEDAHRRLIRLHYLAGDRSAALLAFDRCEAVLKHEVGAAPSAETLGLLRLMTESDRASLPALSPRVALLRPPRLIGRTQELAHIAAALQCGDHVLVVGEAGMGKSRLLEECRSRHRIGISVAARPGDADLPYALFARLVRGFLAGGLEPSAAIRKELTRFIAELGPPPDTTFDLAALEHAAEELLTAARASWPMLVVDDLHHADAASIELLERLAHAAGAPVFLFGARPGEGPAVERLRLRLVEQQRLQPVPLAPLDRYELVALVDSLGVPELRGDALAGPLHRHTGGNPQFALETLRALLLDGRTDDFMRDALPLPAGVGALIEARLKRLSPTAIKLARVGAVAGAQFDAELAARVLGCAVLDLADAWAELEAAQVLNGDAFAHDLVADAVRRSVPRPIARRLHAGIAEALESRDASPAAIAQHWLAAGEAARACPALRAAITQASATSRHLEAAALCGELASVLAGSGDAEGAWEARLQQFDQLISAELGETIDTVLGDLVADARDERQRAQAWEAKARLALSRLDNDAAAAAARDAIDAAQRAAAAEIECDARMALAQALLRQRRPDEAGAVLAALQEWIDASAAPAQRYQYQQCMAWHAIETERYESALRLWQRCTADAMERRSMPEAVTGLSYQVLCLGNMGTFRRAADVGEAMRALMIEHRLFGDPYPLIDSNLAYVYAYAGRHADALAALERAAAAGVVDAATLGLRRAVVYLALGQAGRARRLLEDGLARGRAAVGRHPMLLMLARARHALRARCADAAVLALLDEAEQLARESPKVSLRARALLVRAECVEGAAAVKAALEARRLMEGRDAHGLRLAIESRLAAAWLEDGDIPRALEAAQLPLALAEAYDPELMFPSEVAALLWRVLHAAGDERADAFLAAAIERIHRNAADHVPTEFRDSYLNRLAANRELLTAATRLRRRSTPALPSP